MEKKMSSVTAQKKTKFPHYGMKTKKREKSDFQSPRDCRNRSTPSRRFSRVLTSFRNGCPGFRISNN
ncbi:MAG: hypothetical protein IJS51_06645 [Treponema sp.]|nr:hypothetical protein [Treponema sp.]